MSEFGERVIKERDVEVLDFGGIENAYGSDETNPLERAMCFSIEPGVYLSGKFGVRIDDDVTDDGGRRFNNTSHDLEIVA
jgi:Xaa-Pro aminopeptidase